MKRILSLILLLITLSLPLAGCSASKVTKINKVVYDVGEDIYDKVKRPILKEHDELYDFLKYQRNSPSYSLLFAKHDQLIKHVSNHDDCSFYLQDYYLLLLLGTWKDDNGKYIRLYRNYTDYDNTQFQVHFNTNLSTSNTSGNQYFFYFDATHNQKMIIGYQNKKTEQKIENFRVSFYSDHILLYSFIENKTYTLIKDTNDTGMEKGNSKRAYNWISSFVTHISSTDANLLTFKVEWCYVTDISIYCSLSWEDGNGTLVQKKYRFYAEGETLMYETTSYSYDSNINVRELNDMLQYYIVINSK
jgi:hypothetical protein